MSCADLGPKINLIQSGLIKIVHNLFKRRFEREGLVEPNPICEGQARPTAGTAVGEDHRYELGRKGVEMVDGLGLEEREQLVQGGALGPRCDQAQQHLDQQRREHHVRVLAFAQQ